MAGLLCSRNQVTYWIYPLARHIDEDTAALRLDSCYWCRRRHHARISIIIDTDEPLVCALHLVLSAVILPLCCQFENLHRFLVLGLPVSPLYLEHHNRKLMNLGD